MCFACDQPYTFIVNALGTSARALSPEESAEFLVTWGGVYDSVMEIRAADELAQRAGPPSPDEG